MKYILFLFLIVTTSCQESVQDKQTAFRRTDFEEIVFLIKENYSNLSLSKCTKRNGLIIITKHFLNEKKCFPFLNKNLMLKRGFEEGLFQVIQSSSQDVIEFEIDFPSWTAVTEAPPPR